MQRLPIRLKNRFSIRKRFRLADTLPQQTESSTIGILIGSDYCDEVMLSKKVEVQEGLYLIKCQEKQKQTSEFITKTQCL